MGSDAGSDSAPVTPPIDSKKSPAPTEDHRDRIMYLRLWIEDTPKITEPLENTKLALPPLTTRAARGRLASQASLRSRLIQREQV